MDGDRLRNDLSYADSPDGPITRVSMCRNCEKAGHYVHYMEAPGNAKLTPIMNFCKMGDPNEKKLIHVMDPRVLGLLVCPQSIMFNHRIDSILGQTNRTKPTLERSRWKGQDCFIVRYTLLIGINVQKRTIWIVPSMQYGVVRIELEGDLDGKPYRASVESDLKRYGKEGIWYPKSCTYVSLHDGKIRHREKITVSKATLNEPVSAKVFQISGMDIPPGTAVSGSGLPKGRHSWNGREIVTERNAVPGIGPETPASPPHSGRPLLLVMACVALAEILARGMTEISSGIRRLKPARLSPAFWSLCGQARALRRQPTGPILAVPL